MSDATKSRAKCSQGSVVGPTGIRHRAGLFPEPVEVVPGVRIMGAWRAPLRYTPTLAWVHLEVLGCTLVSGEVVRPKGGETFLAGPSVQRKVRGKLGNVQLWRSSGEVSAAVCEAVLQAIEERSEKGVGDI